MNVFFYKLDCFQTHFLFLIGELSFKIIFDDKRAGKLKNIYSLILGDIKNSILNCVLDNRTSTLISCRLINFQVKGSVDGLPCMLVGNKCDEEAGKREVSTKTGEALQVKISLKS